MTQDDNSDERRARLAERLAEGAPIEDLAGGDPERLRELKELAKLARALETAGRTGRETRDAALAELARTDASDAGPGPRPAPRKLRWAAVLAAVAAMVLVIVWRPRQRLPAPAPAETRLGAEHGDVWMEVDGQGRYGFYWSVTPSTPLGFFRIEVFALTADGRRGDKMFESPTELEHSPWLPSAKFQAQLRSQPRFEWDLVLWEEGVPKHFTWRPSH